MYNLRACMCLSGVCVCLHGLYGVFGMYVCMAQHAEPPATHKENHRGLPQESPPCRGQSQIAGTPKPLAGLNPPGSCSLELRPGETHTWAEGWVLQRESRWAPLEVTQGTWKERAPWKRGKPKQAHEGGTSQGSPGFGAQPCLVNHLLTVTAPGSPPRSTACPSTKGQEEAQ